MVMVVVIVNMAELQSCFRGKLRSWHDHHSFVAGSWQDHSRVMAGAYVVGYGVNMGSIYKILYIRSYIYGVNMGSIYKIIYIYIY